MDIDVTKINMEVNEVLRYAGVKAPHAEKPELDVLKEEVCGIYSELTAIIKPKYTYKDISIDKLSVTGSKLKFEGSSIEKFLCSARKGALMAVSLGHEYEQYSRSRLHMGDSKKSLLLDAVGTEIVEKCADLVEREIRDAACETVSSRFSPGYGDFSVRFQKPLLDYLEAYRIGVYCNEHYMMFPQKTITAVVKFEQFIGGCRTCEKQDCNCRMQP